MFKKLNIFNWFKKRPKSPTEPEKTPETAESAPAEPARLPFEPAKTPDPAEPEPDRLPFEPETVPVPAGPFLMGSDQAKDPQAKDNETPQQRITLPAYRIGKYPVTVGEFRPFIEADGYAEERFWTTAGWARREQGVWTAPGYRDQKQWADDDRLPVIGVRWYEAVAYCRWLAEVTGRPYRLPSEAEWEKAARGTDGRIYPWGDDWRAGLCNTEDARIGRTTPVGQFSPAGDSPYGIADMAGNVDDWCRTVWREQYEHGAAEDEDGDAQRVIRGGNWREGQFSARAAERHASGPSSRSTLIGLRVVVELPAEAD